MKKAFYLSTCSTCKRIMGQLPIQDNFELQDIKTNEISAEQIDELKRLAGNYENLFSRRAMKFKQLGLDQKELTERDYRSLILQEYTFLKRPVFVLNEKIFIGSSKNSIEALKSELEK